MEEVWKRLIYHGEDYGDWYEVSNIGNIRNSRTHRVRKLNVLKQGYAFVGVSLGSRANKPLFKVHRAVAETFIPNPNNLPCIDHIDRNYLNNSVDNLRWCTQKENCNNPLTREYANIKNRSKEIIEKRLATKRKKQSYGCEVPVYYIDEQGKKISFKSMAEAQRQTNVHHFSISLSIKKKRPISGIQWYKEEITSVN